MRKVLWVEGSYTNDALLIHKLAEELWSSTVQYKEFGLLYEHDDNLFAVAEQNGLLRILLGLDEVSYDPVGFYVTLLAPWQFSKHHVISGEVAWYLKPRYMTKTNMDDFLQAIDYWNNVWGATYIQFTFHNIGNSQTARKVAEQHGYALTNYLFMKPTKEC